MNDNPQAAAHGRMQKLGAMTLDEVAIAAAGNPGPFTHKSQK